MDQDINAKNSPWISIKFTNKELEILTENQTSNLYNSGQSIRNLFQRDRNIYIVESGTVQISIYSYNGDKKTVMIANKGNCFGEISAMLENPSFIAANASKDSYVYEIPWNEFKNVLNQNNIIQNNFLEQMAMKSHILISQIQMLSFEKPLTRVKRALYWIFSEYGEKSKEGIRIDNTPKKNDKITHQDIAHITSLSRVSVSNSFSELYKSGKLIKKDGFLYIKSLEDLLN